MISFFNQTIWRHFGGSLTMLGEVIKTCPAAAWGEDRKIFYMNYHVLIFLDYYLSDPVRSFQPLLPFRLMPAGDLPEGAIDDVIPADDFTQEQMLLYLQQITANAKPLILARTEEQWEENWIQPAEIHLHGLCPSLVEHYSRLDILYYNFRHVQHHIGQLNLLMRQRYGVAADWVATSED